MSAETFDSYASRSITTEAVRIYRRQVEASAERGEVAGCFAIDIGPVSRAVLAMRERSRSYRAILLEDWRDKVWPGIKRSRW